MRQTHEEPAVRGYAVTHPAGTVVLPTQPGWDQLVYASAGVMTVEADSPTPGAGTWVVPPHRALWAPSGARHRIVMHGRVSVRTLYLRAELALLPADWRVVNVPPLARELILHAVRNSPLDVRRAEHRRLLGVLGDQLTTLAQAPLQLPVPTDPRTSAFAKMSRADPDATIDQLARRAGTSRRTLERLFVAETAMTIGAWRQRLRLVRSLELLAAGKAVTAVAHAVGYSTSSAFGVMFREQLGESPSRYFRVPEAPR